MIVKKNSVTAFHSLRIKRYFVFSLAIVLAIIVISYCFKQSIKHLVDIGNKTLELSFNAYPLFFTLAILFGAILAFSVIVVISFSILIGKSISFIKYYKTAEITNIQRVTLDFDYKLWQTAPKGTFHAMRLVMKIDNEEKEFLSDIIFTNNQKLGLFTVPKILRSQSYVKDSCSIGYDKTKDKAIILSIEKE